MILKCAFKGKTMRVKVLYWIVVSYSCAVLGADPEYCRGRGRYEFGPNCEYQCRCKVWDSPCDQRDGSCTNGCENGRLGPGCQYVDVAFEMNGVSNNIRELQYALDGSDGWCSRQKETASDIYVTVYLPLVNYISEVAVSFKNYEKARGFVVYAGPTSELSEENLCAEDPGTGTNNRLQIFCGKKMEATYLTLKFPGEYEGLEICQLSVFGGRILEYKRQAYSSSVYENNVEKYGPANAVNGNRDPDTRTGTSLLEERTDPWWYVDLGGKRVISKMKIRIQYDSERQKMRNANIFVCNETDCSDKRVIYQDKTDPVREYIDMGFPDVVARCIGIQLYGEDRQIVLSTVEVYGGCPENRCGMECLDFCYCKDRVKTIKEELDGHCPGDCEKNWLKKDGKCNESICEDGRFGPGCRYECHCEDKCEPWTGECISDMSVSLEKCKKHFYGSLCQGYNTIADSHFTVEGNGTYQSAPLTVDGDITTCSAVLSGHGASWIVPLAVQTYLDQIAVYVNGSTTGFGLEILAENDSKAVLCRSSWFDSRGLYIAYCGHVLSTHVRVRTRSTMQICEVAVLDCANGTFGDLCDNLCHCQGGVPCKKDTGECPAGGCESGYFSSSCSLVCYEGFYGPDCAVQCGYCDNDAVCDRVTGWCPSGCSLGYRGARCDQECRDGAWGDNCAMDCGYCLDGAPCDKMYGLCPYGCGPGFTGSKCTTPCQDGEFGSNCEETCGSCRFGETCRKTDGACRSGCALGKQPPLCQTDCAMFTYGEGCFGVCGHCHYNQTCNPVSGVCENGCEPGYYVEPDGAMCTKECSDGYFGFNCTQRCVVDTCKDTDICNKTNGDCLNGCKYPGYHPPKCIRACIDGTYGFDCSNTCGRCFNNEQCNKTDGICDRGCADGFTGETCQTSELASDPPLSTTSIVLLAVGVTILVLGLAAAVVALVIFRRRRSGKALHEKTTPKDDEATRNASIISRVYENNNINMDTDTSNEKRQNTNNDHYQLSLMKPKYTVAVEDLWDYVLRGKCTKADMNDQYDQLIKGLAHPCESAKKPTNLHKNRYKEIFAYDHTRVKLHTSSESDGDYINASFISGYNRPHRYIAAQGPTEEMVNDFWTMIWQQKCRKIVMLTRLVEQTKMRCAQYWPDEEEIYGSVSVTLIEVDSFADFDIRTFSINVDGQESREVRQFHFTSWPDRQVPEYASSVIQFWSKVRTTDSKDNVPILIHCSAGIGRSGSFIALDYLVDQASVEGYVNVFQCVQNLRHQRVGMVQTQAQYNFLHEALVEALLCPSTPVPCERFPHTYKKLTELESKSRKPRLQCEFEKLQHITKFHESQRIGFYDNDAYMTAQNVENKEKNRSETILPSDMHRPWLTTRVYERNNYINAVFLPSYRDDRKYLLTQNPLPDTIIDFWRMVYENSVTSVVSFDGVSSQSEVYWAGAGETVTYIPFQIHHISEADHVEYTERTLKLLNAEEPKERPRIIKIFECKFWQGEQKVPSDTTPLLTVIDCVQKWQDLTGSPPLVVHCLNGANKSGLFCVILATIAQLTNEREVAIAQTLKQMRIRRHQIVPFYEQYRFAHDVIVEFLKTFDTFSDFII